MLNDKKALNYFELEKLQELICFKTIILAVLLQTDSRETTKKEVGQFQIKTNQPTNDGI